MMNITNSRIVEFSRNLNLVKLVPALKNAESIQAKHVKTSGCGGCGKRGVTSRISHTNTFDIIRRQLGNMSPQVADRFCKEANINNVFVEFKDPYGRAKSRILSRLN